MSPNQLSATPVLLPEPLLPPRRGDDASGYAHRQVVGYLGAALPLAVVVINGLRPTKGLTHDDLSSISAFYYSGAVAVFTGTLAVLAAYLLTYKGYMDALGRLDRRDRTAAVVAGLAAVAVAIFPTAAPIEALRPTWWERWVGWTHYAGASVLFFSFIYFSWFLFPRSGKEPVTSDKRRRNHIYRACGVGMLVCVTWAGVAGFRDRPIFWAEAIALELFALSWLVKGRAGHTAVTLVRRGARRLRGRSATLSQP